MSDLQAHLLVVDDDERIRLLLQKFLVRSGFHVTTARDSAQARRILSGLDFDLIVLDVMMPKEDGISFARDLRSQKNVPILLLTAQGDSTHRIAGLEAGADDYLTKPFEPKELLLRINAILRRTPHFNPDNMKPKVLYLGSVRYDLERNELWRGPTPIRLTATEVQLMKILAAQPGQPVSREQLIGLSDESDDPEGERNPERAVDVQITRLRRKIETDAKQPRYLQTIRGTGYMLQPD